MNFFARYGFVILILCSIIIVGTLVLDAVSPIVTELQNSLSPESKPASPKPTIM